MIKFSNRLTYIIIAAILFTSCGHTGYTEDASGIKALGDELKDEFGNDAYYTSISIADSGTTGDIINVTVTNEPSSNKMGEWTSLRGAWSQSSEITLELAEGTKAEQYMFKLGKRIKMNILGDALMDAKKRLKEEKDITPKVKLISVNAPNDGNFDRMAYMIILEPENGGTSFSFRYKLNGEFIDMDY